MNQEVDWQINCREIKERGRCILESAKWADCQFLVGTGTEKEILMGHKLILAMSSPVFEAMFHGGLPEKTDPIVISDVQPDAFKSLMHYIYTDNVNITSMDKACELCYVAKKYMFPYVVKQCTHFIWSDLCPKNVCRAFEFANLFEEPSLSERCLQVICTKTMSVLNDSSFEEIDLSTLLIILEQEYLEIDSELDLFLAVEKYAKAWEQREANEKAANDEAGPSNQNERRQTAIRDAIKCIRFLTLNPQQFAESVACSTLLTQPESFAILMNISSPSPDIYPMPDGFSTVKERRMKLLLETPRNAAEMPTLFYADEDPPARDCRTPMIYPYNHNNSNSHMELRKFYSVRTIRLQIDYLNTSVSDCYLTFSVDRPICITGIQVPTQVLGEQNLQAGNLLDHYSECLYANLLDSYGVRLTYTHCTSSVRFDTLLEISFNRPVVIERNKMYKIGVVFNKPGWYPMCTCVPSITCENVCFTFNVGNPTDSVRDGLIRAIVFTMPR